MQLDYSDYSIYIVDNNSEEKEKNKLISWSESQAEAFVIPEEEIPGAALKSVSIILKNENIGFAGANNTVLRFLKEKSSEFLCLLNPDMLVSANILMEFVSQNTGLLIQGAPTYSQKDKDRLLHYGAGLVNHNSATIQFLKNSSKSPDYINGGCMFFSTEVLKLTGLLPEKYFLYWEETHWCFLARQKNVSLKINHKVKVWDKGSTSIGKGLIAEYYYTRNGLFFKREFYKNEIALNILMHLFRLIYRLLSLRFERAKGIFLGIRDFLFSKDGKLR